MSKIEPYHLNESRFRSLRTVFGDRLRSDVSLARFTAARIGGPADVLLEVQSAEELAQACHLLWDEHLPFMVMGGGSNMLVSDAGFRGVALINRAREVRFDETSLPPSVWAESGANIGVVARQAASRGLAGLEWASGVPGTVGGAVVGNAGAHDGDMAGNLLVAEILHQDQGREQWSVDRLGYQYRSSVLKAVHPGTSGLYLPHTSPPKAVVLAASLKLERSDIEKVQTKIDEFVAHRRHTQPPGASMGSMFKNPGDDYAGRLIESAGLKGARIGDAQISSLHANFFLNLGRATALDVYKLIQLARQTVAAREAVELELEVELIGDWKAVLET